MQNSSGQKLVDKVRAMFEELERGPRRPATTNDIDEQLAFAAYCIQLAEELLRLGPQLSGPERSACPDGLVRVYLASNLWLRFQYHVTRGLGAWRYHHFAPTDLRRNVSERPEAIRCIELALPDLDRYLAVEMKEVAAFRDVALRYRCNCNRVLAVYDLALRDAHELVKTRDDEVAFALLSHCYFDIGDYEKAEEAATEAIIRARSDWAWDNRAEIHRTFGNLTAYEYDKQQADELRRLAQARGF